MMQFENIYSSRFSDIPVLMCDSEMWVHTQYKQSPQLNWKPHESSSHIRLIQSVRYCNKYLYTFKKKIDAFATCCLIN